MSDAVKPEDCLHCWHSTGLAMTSNPPQYLEVCCHCEEYRTLRPSAPHPPMHGPFLPKPGR